jgi:hypothetical protein
VAKDSSVKVVLIVVGGIVLVVAIVCGGLTYVGYLFVTGVTNTMQQAVASAMQQLERIQRSNDAAVRFLEDIDGGDLDAAYDRTSAGFRMRHDRKAFDETVRKNGLVGARVPPGEVPGQPVGAQAPANNEIRFIFRRRTPDGRTISLTVDVEEVEEVWRVKEWQVADHGREGRDAPPPDDEKKP